MKKALLSGSLLFSLPYIAFAQGGTNLFVLLDSTIYVINRLIPILIGIALIVFFWGLIKYIQTGKEGKTIMIAGIVGLFLMVSIWGIIRLVNNTLGVPSGGSVSAPQIQYAQ